VEDLTGSGVRVEHISIRDGSANLNNVMDAGVDWIGNEIDSADPNTIEV
jgi:hypothetical protein